MISNNPHLSVRSSVSCGVLVFVGSFSCDGKRMDALCGAISSGEKCFGTFGRTLFEIVLIFAWFLLYIFEKRAFPLGTNDKNRKIVIPGSYSIMFAIRSFFPG